MPMNVRTFSLAVIATALFALPAAAHHSFAMFDADKTVNLTGIVKEMEWANPHCWIYMMAQDENGKIQEYALEMQGPGQSLHNGWKPDSVKAGDKITAAIHPLRTGAHGGQLLSVVLASGQKLNATGKAPSPYGE
jgi:uncharacterized protein DUF6152